VGIALVLAPCAWLTGRATRRLAETARGEAVPPVRQLDLDEA
jgi:hypothetical protein